MTKILVRWWAAVCGVPQSRTRLKWLSRSSSNVCLVQSVPWEGSTNVSPPSITAARSLPHNLNGYSVSGMKASLGSGGSSTLSHQPDPFLRSSVTRAWAFVCNPFGNTWTPRPRSRSKGLGKAQLERRDGRLVTAESCHGHSGSSIQIHPYWTVSVFEESASKGLLATGSNNQQAIWIPLLLTSVIFD